MSKYSLTKEKIEGHIASVDYAKYGKTGVHCVITLVNGYTVTGESNIVDPTTYNEDKGKEIAYSNAFNKLTYLVGYLEKQRWYEETQQGSESELPSECAVPNSEYSQKSMLVFMDDVMYKECSNISYHSVIDIIASIYLYNPVDNGKVTVIGCTNDLECLSEVIAEGDDIATNFITPTQLEVSFRTGGSIIRFNPNNPEWHIRPEPIGKDTLDHLSILRKGEVKRDFFQGDYYRGYKYAVNVLRSLKMVEHTPELVARVVVIEDKVHIIFYSLSNPPIMKEKFLISDLTDLAKGDCIITYFEDMQDFDYHKELIVQRVEGEFDFRVERFHDTFRVKAIIHRTS